MRRSTVLATVALAFFMVGTPVMVVGRVLGGLFPVQAFDFVLVMFVVGWVQLGIAVIKRNDALDSLTQQRVSLQWQADNIVAQSLIGVGLHPRQTVSQNGLVRVGLPSESIDALLPPAAIVDDRAVRLDEDADAPLRLIPSLAEPESDGPEVLATEEYVVARGDTFWSIAEYAFGDGRHWQTVQELNLGREVAPGVVLDDSHEPRIGWSILIPLVESSSDIDV